MYVAAASAEYAVALMWHTELCRISSKSYNLFIDFIRPQMMLHVTPNIYTNKQLASFMYN
jgi:hypothetical protein